jgi:hypothetical protein
MMKSGHQLFSACLATFVAAGFHVVSAAEEVPVVAQDLVNVRASTSIAAALWTRRPDSYTLQIAFIPVSHNGCPALKPAPAAASTQQPNAVVEMPVIDRSTFFIGNTIASLRDLDPCFGTRTLFQVDGRRVVSGTSPPDSSRTVEQPVAQKSVVAPPTVVVPPKGPPGIQVWLLGAEGAQISPVAVATENSYAYGCKINCPESGKQYRFPLLEGAQATAVVISVDGVYYIEKLQSLEPASVKQ